MISFRFHLVSLIAVFLALGIGIAVGATVVNEATVELLQDRVEAVARQADATNRENDALEDALTQWQRFADQAGDELVVGRLPGADVLLVGVQGVDRDPVDLLRQSLLTAGARVQGTVWFTRKLALEDPRDVAQLGELVGLPSSGPEAVRRTVLARLAEQWASGPGSLLPRLSEAGFVDFEAPPGTGADPATVPAEGTRFVVTSGPRPDVANDQLALPFTVQLARWAPSRVLAVEAGRDARGDRPAERAVFLGPLRDDDALDGRLATVDNLEDFRGRVAAVLAVGDLGANGKVGDYGVGPRATRLLPEPAS